MTAADLAPRSARLADRLERWPGLGRAVAFYRYIRLDLPWSTTALGVALLCGVAAIRVSLLVDGMTDPAGPRVPVYGRVYFGLIAACALLAAAGLLVPRRSVARAGWAIGGVVCTVALVIYLLSRIAGVSGLARWSGRWDYPLGTVGMAVEGAFLAVLVAVATGAAVARPDSRRWRD